MWKQLLPFLLTAFMSIIGANVYAQDSQNKRTIHVETAGTLSSYISEEEKYQIEELTLTGELNGTDFYFIRDMAGDKVSYGMLMGSPTLVRHHSSEGILKSLDISNAKIVQGGEYHNYINYWDTYLGLSTSDNKITTGLFTDMHLETIILPINVVYIGGWNYKYNYAHDLIEGYTGAFPKSLTNITIPNSVTSIGGYAFINCQSMTSIVSQIENPFEISENVFPYYIYSTATLTVPYGTKSLYESTNGWKRFQNIVEAPSPKRTIHVETAGTLPDLISEDDKYMIEELTLTGELNGTDIHFIRDMAGINTRWEWTNNLSANAIGAYVIEYTTEGKLSVLDITEAKIVSGGSEYYEYGKYISKNGSYPELYRTKDNSISELMFYGCKLNTIKLPNSVTSIEESAFAGCKGLTSISIPNSVTTIDIGAFCGCSSLTSLTISNCVSFIDVGTFQGCISLTTITIPNSVTSISSYAFEGCSGLTSVIIGHGVTSIGADVFSNCPNLREMILSQAAYDNGIPESVTKFTTYSKNPMRVEVLSRGVVSATMKIYPIDEQGNTYESNYYTVTTFDQTPGEYIKWKLDDENYGIISEKTEGTLTLETQPAQPMSTTKARLIATVNEADDDQHFGFEWLRYNAPDDMPPYKVSAPLYEGHIVGSLGGLNPDVYYKYRPFYQSDSGEMTYGKWIAFNTGDANAFFEPEVHTKDATAIKNDGALLSGVFVEGTEDILERGFKYWTVSGSTTRTINEDAMTVAIIGSNTSVTLTGMKAGTEYGYCSYVKTASGKTYGEEKTFKTQLLGDANNDGKVDAADIVEIVNAKAGKPSASFNMSNVDTDGDSNLTDTDINTIVKIIMGK